MRRTAVDLAYRKILAASSPVLVPFGNGRIRERLSAGAGSDLERRARAALGRGLGWFQGQADLELSALFLLEELSRKPHGKDFAFVAGRIERYLATHRSFRNRMFDRDYPYDPTLDPMGVLPETAAGEEVYDGPIHPLMRRCLYSDRLGLGEAFLDELARLDDGGGYGTTHIIVGCKLLKRFGTIDHAAIDRLMASTAPSIVRAQRTSWAGDLFAERIVALQWLNRPDLVDPAWIWRLLRSQNEDGGWWMWPSIGRNPSNQHTTSLAVGALYYFLHPADCG